MKRVGLYWQVTCLKSHGFDPNHGITLHAIFSFFKKTLPLKAKCLFKMKYSMWSGHDWDQNHNGDIVEAKALYPPLLLQAH